MGPSQDWADERWLCQPPDLPALPVAKQVGGKQEQQQKLDKAGSGPGDRGPIVEALNVATACGKPRESDES